MRLLQNFTPTQEIKCSFDFLPTEEPEQDIESAKVMELFFPKKMVPVTYIALELQKSKAFLQMEESVFGELSGQESFLNSVKTVLNESVFTFTSSREDTDFIVKLKSEFIAGEEKKETVTLCLLSLPISISQSQMPKQTKRYSLTGLVV